MLERGSRPCPPMAPSAMGGRGNPCASPPAPLHYVERGEGVGTGRFSAGAGRGRGGDGRGPYARWSKAAGGAVLGWQDALGGIVGRWERGRAYSPAPLWSPRGAGGRGWPHPRPLSTMWRGVDLCFRGIGRTWYRGTRCGCGRCVGGCVGRSGCGDWQGCGARPSWRGRCWPAGKATVAIRHGTQTVLTRRPGRDGRGYVSTRCPKGGARTVMPHHVG